MPGGYNDAMRTAVEVLLRTGGTGEIDQAKDAMVQLQAAMTSTAVAGPEAAGGIEEFISALLSMARDLKGLSKFVDEYEASVVRASQATLEWVAMQNALGAMEARSAQEMQQAAEAVRDGTKAVEERMRAIQAAEQAEGDAMRRRIDAYARAERTEEHFAESTRKAMETVRQIEGDAMRARIDAYARADEARMRNAATAREADEAISRGTSMLMAQQEDLKSKQMAAAGAADWLNRQELDLTQTILALAAAEKTADVDTVRLAEDQRAAAQAAGALAAGFKNVSEMHEHYAQRSAAAARTTIAFAYAFDDLTAAGDDWFRGLTYAVNNVPQIAMGVAGMMGASATAAMAWAGGIGAVTVAIAALARHWDTLMDKFGVGIPTPALEGVEGLKKQLKDTEKTIDDLHKQKRLDLTELMDLEKATAKAKELNAELTRQKELKDLLDTTPKEQRERAAGFEEAIGQSGGGRAVLDLITTAFERTADAQGKVKDDTTNTFTDAKTAAENLLLEARKGFLGERNRVSQLARSVPGGEEFSRTITETAPETKMMVEANKDAQEFVDRVNKAKKKAHDEAAKRTEEAVDAAEDAAIGIDDADAKRAKKAAEKQAIAATRQAANDIRDEFRSIAASDLDAGGKQQAIQGVANKIRAQAEQLGAEAVGDLMTEARAAFKRAAREGDAALKRDQAEDVKAARDNRPNAVIQHAAQGPADVAANFGIPQHTAQRDIAAEIEKRIRHGQDMDQAMEAVWSQLEAYIAFKDQQLAMQGMRMQRMNAHARGNRGNGRMPLQPSVPNGWGP